MNYNLKELSKPSIIAICFLLVGFFGVLDYLIEPELILPYLIPVSLAAWLAGRRWGIVLSILSDATWSTAKALARGYHPDFPVFYWDIAVRPIFFIIISYTLSSLRAAKEKRDELTYFIVHDLRSQLTNILMGINILQDASVGITSPMKQDILESCSSSCSRMSILVTSLLDSVALESGKMQLNMLNLSIQEILSDSLREVSLWAKRMDVTLRTEIDDNIQEVFTDKILIARVLVNLLSNAIKVSPSGSFVSIRVERLNPDSVVFRVIDRGHGIPKKMLNMVFDKFKQAEVRKAGYFGGSGLGLTFCRQAVEALGGTIGINSEVGKGTTVYFTMPVHQRNKS